MIREWILGRLLKNKMLFFEDEEGGYHLINDILVDNNVVVCKYCERDDIE